MKLAGDFLAGVGVDQSDGVLTGGELGDSVLDVEGVAEPVAVGEVCLEIEFGGIAGEFGVEVVGGVGERGQDLQGFLQGWFGVSESEGVAFGIVFRQIPLGVFQGEEGFVFLGEVDGRDGEGKVILEADFASLEGCVLCR